MNTLYMIPVPIADNALDTLPARTIDRTRNLAHFLVENAKTARHFLKSVAHPVPLQELHIIEIGHKVDAEKIDFYLKPLSSGADIGILSESGCPGIADPGAKIAFHAQQRGIRVVPLIGPCSPVLALMASGLDGQNFRFCGYLPIKEEERRKAILKLERLSGSEHGETQLFIETPYRNQALFLELIRHLAETTSVLVATDISGTSECIHTLSVAEWRKRPLQLPKLPTVFGLMAQTRSRH